MQPLVCQTCDARVSVAKYSPAHTSIQWTAEAKQFCHEMASASAVGNGNCGYVLRCAALDRSIDEAVTRGDVPMSTRSEPRVRPLSAGDVVAENPAVVPS
ncbi:hypothetical protein FOV72_00315 [Gordonia rubripertincta]|uniref:Ferredoxin n=1 Tax=Gordonia rubripertincta TaxID=36822 RepID=A0AAW4G4R9_GORRU|nr:hypothetical protein [Gordonia rubripertincta]MBM7278526.1 hypothetical protein [Gordonia rubripertincta]QMU23088.1 hypothetical protein H3V45_11830 [Gordonia rubripertincta]TSD98268.1 hypothetical protein FOV72_00315 [Gordonia rubripertincta]